MSSRGTSSQSWVSSSFWLSTGQQDGEYRLGCSDEGREISAKCHERSVVGHTRNRTKGSASEEGMDQRPIGVLSV